MRCPINRNRRIKESRRESWQVRLDFSELIGNPPAQKCAQYLRKIVTFTIFIYFFFLF